jgi:hypothetical protein
MTVRVDESLDGIDWEQAKADLAADDFDNGRSARALQASSAVVGEWLGNEANRGNQE